MNGNGGLSACCDCSTTRDLRGVVQDDHFDGLAWLLDLGEHRFPWTAIAGRRRSSSPGRNSRRASRRSPRSSRHCDGRGGRRGAGQRAECAAIYRVYAATVSRRPSVHAWPHRVHVQLAPICSNADGTDSCTVWQSGHVADTPAMSVCAVTIKSSIPRLHRGARR